MNDLIFFIQFFLQKIQNETYLSMVNQTLNTPFFYFSYTYDLTHTLQRLSAMDPNFYEVKLEPFLKNGFSKMNVKNHKFYWIFNCRLVWHNELTVDSCGMGICLRIF